MSLRINFLIDSISNGFIVGILTKDTEISSSFDSSIHLFPVSSKVLVVIKIKSSAI